MYNFTYGALKVLGFDKEAQKKKKIEIRSLLIPSEDKFGAEITIPREEQKEEDTEGSSNKDTKKGSFSIRSPN